MGSVYLAGEGGCLGGWVVFETFGVSMLRGIFALVAAWRAQS